MKHEFASIKLHGHPSGMVLVFAEGKLLGSLFQQDGQFCVQLYGRVVKSIGKSAEDQS